MSADRKIAELNLILPPAPAPVGVYKPAVIVGELCFTSGHGPMNDDGSLITGCVGRDIDQEVGYQAARQTGLSLLATLQSSLGSLNRVKRVVKLLGMVWCTPDFDQHPAVINGCSELFREVFGEEIGVGVRSAVGMNSLPLGMAVEIEGIFKIDR